MEINHHVSHPCRRHVRIGAFLVVCLLWWGNLSPVSAQQLGRVAADSLHQVLHQLEYGEERVDVKNELAYALYTEVPESTAFWAHQAFQRAHDLGYDRGKARATTVRGIGLYAQGMPEAALPLFRTARQQWEDLGDEVEAAATSANLGLILLQQGDLARALEAHLQARRVFEEQGSSDRLVSVYNNLGVIYAKQNDLDEAYHFYSKSHDAARSLRNPTLVAMGLANKANVRKEQERYDEALAGFREALDLYRQQEVTEHRVRMKGAIGSVYLAQESYDEALNTFTESIALAELHGLQPMPFILRGRGMAELRDGSLRAAEAYFDRAEAALEQTPDPSERKRLVRARHELLAARGDYESALAKYREYTSIRDSLFSHERAERMAQLRAQYDIDQQELENELLRIREAEQEATIARQRWGFVIGGLVLLILLSLFFLFYRTNGRLQRAVKTLEERNAVINKQRDELRRLNASKDELFAVIGHDLRGPVSNIKMLLDTLLRNPSDVDPEAARDLLQMADETAAASITLLENLLYWAQSQRGELADNPEPTTLRTLLHRNMKLLRAEAKSKNIRLSMVIEEDTVAMVDENMASIVLRNIIANAIKFTPDGGQITIRASNKGAETLVSVQDTGVGMSEEQIEQLLDSDAQPGSSRGTSGEMGTGLGLRLCHQLMKRTHGEIEIESQPDSGTMVIVRWPAVQADAEAPVSYAA